MRPKTVRQVLKLRSRISSTLAGVVLVAAFAAAVCQSLYSTKLVKVPPTLLVILVLVAGVGALGQGLIKVTKRARYPLTQQQVDDLRQAVATLAVQVHLHSGIGLRYIGGGVWIIRRYRPWLWRPRLHRVVRFRLNVAPEPSDIDWTPDKGAVGKCWTSKKAQFNRWHELCDKYVSETELTDLQWRRIEAGKSFGFTRSEFESMLGKYSEVGAFPLKDRDGLLIGVISIDIPYEAVSDSRTLLDTREIKGAALAAASLMRNTLASR